MISSVIVRVVAVLAKSSHRVFAPLSARYTVRVYVPTSRALNLLAPEPNCNPFDRAPAVTPVSVPAEPSLIRSNSCQSPLYSTVVIEFAGAEEASAEFVNHGTAMLCLFLVNAVSQLFAE